MSKKRPLTDEEKAMAAKMKAAIANTPGLTEEIVGAHMGVTQGQISHWTGGRLPVPARRATALAQILGIRDPGEISLQYRAVAPRSVREAPAVYVGGGEDVVADLRQEVAALRLVIATMLTVSTAHRPAEVADVAKRLRRHTPVRLGRGFVGELLETLDKAVPPDTAAAGPKHRSGSTSR